VGSVSIEVFLLLVILVLLSVILFVLLLTALYVTRLYRRLKPLSPQPRTGAVEQKENSSAVAAVPGKSVSSETAQVETLPPPSVEMGKARDLESGMELICSEYGLDSLTIATWDGLLVASSGSPSRMEDAALFSRIYRIKGEIEDKSVQLFELEYKGSRLIGIARRKEPLVEAWTASLRHDVTTLLRAWI